MQESYDEGLASHIGPESCAQICKDLGEALTGVRAGWVWSCENRTSLTGVQGADDVPAERKAKVDASLARDAATPCAVRDPIARTETPRTGIGRSPGRLPIRGGRIGKSKDVSR
jgi:hypothetical protein